MKRHDIEQKLYWYSVQINFIYDGDSITAYELDFGFGFKKTVGRGEGGIRFYGINTPELNTSEGILVRDYIKPIEGQKVFVRSHRDKSGKYGRYLFELFVPETYFGGMDPNNYINLNHHLLEKGMATKMSY